MYVLGRCFLSYLKNDTEVIVVVDDENDSTIQEIEKSKLNVKDALGKAGLL